MDATSYAGRHSELYDFIYASKPYSSEAGFVHDCFQRFGAGGIRRILEIACGTGGHAFELERLGYEVVATDYSPSMLARARLKAGETLSRVRFEQRDMRSLEVADEPFDAAVCLFNSIGYVVTNDALLQTFRGVHRHLRPGGLFVFEFWHAAAMLRSYEPTRVGRWPIPEGELLRISETELDVESQLAKVSYSLYELRDDGTFSLLQETQVNRYFLVQEMAAALVACGFSLLKCFAGFSFEALDRDTWRVVAVARRESMSTK